MTANRSPDAAPLPLCLLGYDDRAMDEIASGRIVAFYLFDVAESIDLALVSQLVGVSAEASRLAPKPATPAYVQYEKPPITIDGDAFKLAAIEGFRSRARLYDYGVVSIALSRPFAGSWAEFLALGERFIESPELERHAEQLSRTVLNRVESAVRGVRQDLLSEDYLVLAVHELQGAPSADALLAERGAGIAAMLRGERAALSAQEQSSILNHRISYLANDVVIPTWNAAFVYDTPAGTQAALDILEFANSQLLEFRYYDQLLDRELAGIYARLQRPQWYEQWIGSRYTRAARQVHSLYIDLNELTDRTENAVKFIGDIYAVRLFRLAADRLALASWKADVEQKLDTMDDIYRFAVEQSGLARGQVLELTIVLILILELGLFFAGVMP
jgi:hypothetical protein